MRSFAFPFCIFAGKIAADTKSIMRKKAVFLYFPLAFCYCQRKNEKGAKKNEK